MNYAPLSPPPLSAGRHVLVMVKKKIDSRVRTLIEVC